MKMRRPAGPRTLVVLAWTAATGLAAPATPPITSIAAVRSLTVEEVDRQPACRLEGVVTFAYAPWSSFFLNDGQSGICFIPPEGAIPQLKAGGRIRIDGVVGRGQFAPILKAAHVELLGAGELPGPRAVAAGELDSGAEDSQWIELAGTELEAHAFGTTLEVLVAGPAGEFSASILGAASIPPVGSRLRLQGVCVSDLDVHGRFERFRLVSPGAGQLVVLERGPEEPLKLPVTPLPRLLTYTPPLGQPQLQHVSGVVTALRPDGSFFLQEGGAGVLVAPSAAARIEPGSKVEAAGFAARGPGVPTLGHAVVQASGVQTLPAPKTVDEAGLQPADNGVLLSVDGEWHQAWRQNRLGSLLVSLSDGSFCSVRCWPDDQPSPWEELSPGAKVRVTGVLDTGSAGANGMARAVLWLPTRDHVTVLTLGGWLNGGRVKAVLSALGAAAATLAIMWIGARRKLREQSAELSLEFARKSEAEARSQELVENAKDAIFTVDAEGRISGWNPAALRLTGLTREQADACPKALDFVAPEQREEAAARFRKRLSGVESSELLTVEVLAADGRRTPVELSSRLVRPPSRAPHLECVARDISDRRRVETALRESDATHRAIVEALAEGVLIVDAEGRTVSANQMALEILGLPRAALDERSICDLEYWGWKDGAGKPLQTGDCPTRQTISTGVSHRNVVLGVDIAGRERLWLAVNTAVIRADARGAAVLVAISFRDISLQKAQDEQLRQAKEAAEAASQAKTDFLAVMSHEIRTPLNGVIGFTDLLLEAGLTTEQERYAETIRNSGEALLDVINDVLDLSKIEAGRLELQSEPFNLLAVVDAVATLMSVRAEQKGLEFVVDYWPQAAVEIVGDRARVRQVLTNLTANAIKYTNRGSVLIEVRPGAKGNEEVEIRIRDTGAGISEADQSRLFEKFRQLGAAAQQRGGTGLGLAISKELVEMMGGRIGYETVAGKGSTFWFALGLTPGFASLTSTPPQEIEGARTLLVSRSTLLTNAMERRLKAWGCLFEAATTLEQADALVEDAAAGRHPFEFILIDACQQESAETVATLTRWRKEHPAALIAVTPRSLLKDSEARSWAHAILPTPVALPEPLREVMMDGWRGTLTAAPDRAHRNAPLRVLIADSDRADAMVAAYVFARLGCQVRLAASSEEAEGLLRDFVFHLATVEPAMADRLSGWIRERLDEHAPKLLMLLPANGDAQPPATVVDGTLRKPLNATLLRSTLTSLNRRS